MNKLKKISFLLLGLAILTILFGAQITHVLTNWWWFKSIELEDIFLTRIKTQILLGLGAFIATFIIIYGNLRLAQYLTKNQSFEITLGENKKEIITKKKSFTKYLIIATVIISGFIGLGMTGAWKTVLKFINQTSFHTQAPIIGRDISFYIFEIPFWKLVTGWGLWVAILTTIGTGTIYFFRGVISKKGKSLSVNKKSRIHLGILMGIIFLTIAFQIYYISIPELLFSEKGVVYGAGYTDIHATLPYLKILTILALAAALASFFNVFKKALKTFGTIVVLYLIAVIVGGWIYPAALQNFVVAPNELTREKQYIKDNIKSTRKAYKLNKIEEKQLGGTKAKLTFQDIQENKSTTQNIRLWDRKPLLDTFGQLQEIRTYYNFRSIDTERYHLNGEYRQIMLSPRELDYSKLPQRNFINEHLVFTHGYGLTAGPVNKVTKKGLPKLYVKDFPPQSEKEALSIKRPEIYYGEGQKKFAFANTKLKEFDYPSGEKNVYTHYKGKGGIPVNNTFRKAVLASRLSSLKVFLSDNITNQSQALINRNIKARVREAYSFLKIDQDPYLIITPEGQLKWIVDAYTLSGNYTYSKPVKGGNLNYIRNSAKIVVDAYNGSMQAYIADKEDPIIQTYAKIFPGVFKSFSEMPSYLRQHIRYPETLFSIQTSLYSTYHMQDPNVFYNREDKWTIPSYRNTRTEKEDPMRRHIILKLPGETKEEFVFMVPFTPQGKDNMAGWMAARNDSKNYGRLIVYKFPKKSLVYGPKQINNRIDQNTTISKQISLWDQRGSEVIRGNLLVIPIEHSLIYVQPIYLQGQGGSIPELKRVIVAYRDNIVMEPTLDKALNSLFAKSKGETSSSQEKSPETTIPQSLLQEAKNYYQQALQAQREGNWSQYGDSLDKLGETLNEIK